MTLADFLEKLSKVLDSIQAFFEKFWLVVLVPIGLFIVALFTRKKNTSGAAEINDLKQEIKQDCQDIEAHEAEVKETEEKLSQQIEDLHQEPEQKAELDDQVSDILPGLKK
jgi:uncharacterized membrane-anchored protein YhcB (DUF1043 family)